jgi:hypothetical protein
LKLLKDGLSGLSRGKNYWTAVHTWDRGATCTDFEIGGRHQESSGSVASTIGARFTISATKGPPELSILRRASLDRPALQIAEPFAPSPVNIYFLGQTSV